MSDEQFGWLVTHLDSICEFSLLLLPFTMILLTWAADKLKPPHADDW